MVRRGCRFLICPQLLFVCLGGTLAAAEEGGASLSDRIADQSAPSQATDAGGEFWSFQPLRSGRLPTVENKGWVRTPIDRFVLATLESRGLSPNRSADRRTLIRRSYFDIVGLPPSPQAVADFLADEAPDAYERLVNHLLASPAYGERWARHWLDVVRFAESDGFEHDNDRPYAYHYRDFVIRALNRDMPFDRFARWQIAGDEFAPDDPLALMATGFLTAGVFPTQITEVEFERTRYDQLDDMATTMGVALLGLSVGCARCHDHKYDPISSQDYYQLLSSFTKTIRNDIEVDLSPLGVVASDKQKIQISSEGLPAVKNHADGRGYPHFYPQTHILARGDPAQKRGVATQSFLRVLMRNGKSATHWQETPPKDWRTSYQRRSLANWLVDPQDGAGHLLARVIVNRLWQHHLGRGIVATPNDFGTQGERPTHAQLLDWLALELIRGGWRLKPIHKLIVTSSVYMQSSAYDGPDAATDPQNRWYWRHDMSRLDAEVIRDSLLLIGGRLDDRMYGPGTLDESMRRRSVYFTVKRSKMISSMQLFDMPEPLVSVGARTRTTTAPQALSLLNSPQVRRCAEGLARQLEPLAVDSFQDAIVAGYRAALCRLPTAEESASFELMLQQDVADYQAEGRTDVRGLALINFCQLLMCMNEFVYVD